MNSNQCRMSKYEHKNNKQFTFTHFLFLITIIVVVVVITVVLQFLTWSQNLIYLNYYFNFRLFQSSECRKTGDTHTTTCVCVCMWVVWRERCMARHTNKPPSPKSLNQLAAWKQPTIVSLSRFYSLLRIFSSPSPSFSLSFYCSEAHTHTKQQVEISENWILQTLCWSSVHNRSNTFFYQNKIQKANSTNGKKGPRMKNQF